MMHCFICDREDDLITFEKLTGSYSPCTICQEAINECLEAFEEDNDDALPPTGKPDEAGKPGEEPSTEVQSAVSAASFDGYLVTSLRPACPRPCVRCGGSITVPHGGVVCDDCWGDDPT